MKTTYLILMFSLLLFPAHTLFAQWETVFFTEAGGVYAASSELEKPTEFMEVGEYSPMNLFDDSLETSWVEGEAGPGTGSYVLIGQRGELKKYIMINNGYQKSESLFLKNNRVKDFKLSLYSGFTSDMRAGQIGFEADILQITEPVNFTLKDEMGVQPFEMPFETAGVEALRDSELIRYTGAHPEEPGIQEFLILKFEIASVYEGSLWDDTCIAGISFSNRSQENCLLPNEHITGAFTEVESENVFVQTSQGRKLLLVDAKALAKEKGYTAEGEFLTFTLFDVSPDNLWAVIIEDHGFTSGGHIEETSQLWSLARMKEVPPALMEAYKATPLGFKIRSGTLYLETYEDKFVRLEDLDLDMMSGRW